MSVNQYDIFSGVIDKNAMWVEAVEGLGASIKRMKELATDSPGHYFVFCANTHKVLASIDNSEQGEKQIGVQGRKPA